jgi:hypothetical protein
VSKLGRPVKCLHWIIVILAIGVVSLAPIVPRVDAPETVYNETDTPVNLATPVVVGTSFTKPSEKPAAIGEERGRSREPYIAHAMGPEPGVRDSRSPLSLLCKFLC